MRFALSYSVFSPVALKELHVDNSLQISKLKSKCSHRAQEIGKGSETRVENTRPFLIIGCHGPYFLVTVFQVSGKKYTAKKVNDCTELIMATLYTQ